MNDLDSAKMKDLTVILDEIEARNAAWEEHLDAVEKHPSPNDVPALVRALRYCQNNIIDNLPSIARLTFTEKLANILDRDKTSRPDKNPLS